MVDIQKMMDNLTDKVNIKLVETVHAYVKTAEDNGFSPREALTNPEVVTSELVDKEEITKAEATNYKEFTNKKVGLTLVNSKRIKEIVSNPRKFQMGDIYFLADVDDMVENLMDELENGGN